MISIARTMAKVFLLVLSAALVSACAQVITVNPDGTFSPDWVEVNDGDFVYWVLSEPSDSVIPVSWRAPFPDICGAYRPYDATDPNEFTGPLIQAPAGVFVLGPNEQGVQIVNESDPGVPPCSRSDSQFASGSQYLCPSAVKNETMPWTWRNPSITGVFIRLEWDDVHLGPDSYDWTALDREIERAVQNGKLYSLAFKAGNEGTPGWIFDPAVAGSDVVQRVQLQDTGSHRLPGQCGVPMTLGSPADPNYRKHYFTLLRAAASHIREKNAWYRALAYIKPSGANLFSHENRLPKNCDTSNGCFCNPEAWALYGGYTPSALYEFYHEQTTLLADEFPDKDMSYMLIQAGFPLVNDMGDFLTNLPGGTEQTEVILEQGQADHGVRFVVQHNGLGPSGAPNPWVLGAGAQGQFTAFQTINTNNMTETVDLEATFQNAWNNSDAIMVEIYESLFWFSEVAGPILDPASGKTIADWNQDFETRRTDLGIAMGLEELYPVLYGHQFKRTREAEGSQIFYYVHGSKCGTSGAYGAISVLP